jgi:hypothetical protein
MTNDFSAEPSLSTATLVENVVGWLMAILLVAAAVYLNIIQ